MELFKQILDQVKLIYQNMTKPQRVSLLLIGVSMFLCLMVVFMWSSKPSYAVLFSDLSMKDAGEVQTTLIDLDIPHEIVGNTIKVPSDKVYETRILLANEGLPKNSGIGFEIFDKIKVGQTDYMQRLNFQRALEGELSRTITSLSQIEFARVHLVLPEKTIFTDEEKSPSASIVLTFHGGGHLDKQSVMSIKHLVSTSVEGLTPESVTIVDSNGNLLSSAADENDLLHGLTARQIDVQRNVETYLERKASSLLMGILGPDKSIVRVSALLDFSQKEKTQESYRPDEQIARSENRIEESAKGEQGAANSVEKVVTNYEIGRTVEHMIGATGSIERISVAVVIDGTYSISEEGTTEYVSRSAEEIESIQRLTVNALGLDLNRGDQIEVSNIAFDKTYLQEKRLEQKRADNRRLISKVLSSWPWIIVFILLGYMLLTFRKIMTSASDVSLKLPKNMLFGKSVGGIMVDDEDEEGREKKDRGKGLEVPEQTKLEEEVLGLASKNPDTIARIINSWINEPKK